MKAGKAGPNELASAMRRLDAAKEAFSVTTKCERDLRQQAQDLAEQAEAALASGDKKTANRLQSKADKLTKEADYVLQDRLAHRAAARANKIKVTDPATGQQHEVSRFLIEKAVNAQNAAKVNPEAVVPGVNGGLEKAKNTWAAKSTHDEMVARMDECRQIAAECKTKEDGIKAQIDKLKEKTDSNSVAQSKALKKQLNEINQVRANANREHVELLAATEGAKMLREGKLPKRDSATVAQAAVFDTVNSRGQKGESVKFITNKAERDSLARVPKGMQVVPGSVRTTKFTTFHNGEVIDAQVKVNDVYDPKTGKYHTVTSITGKSALYTSNNCMQAYSVGHLNDNTKTSRGRFEHYEMSEGFTSKKAVRTNRNACMRQLSVSATDTEKDTSQTAVGKALTAAGTTNVRRLKMGNIAHPEVAQKALYEIDGEKY